MKNNNKIWGLFLAALVLLPGCMHVPTYRRQPLRSVGTTFAYQAFKKRLIMNVKRLNGAEICSLFGERAQWFMSFPSRPQVIYVSITNMSNDTYLIDPYSIDLPLINYEHIALSMKTGILGQPGKNARNMDEVDALATYGLAAVAAPIGMYSFLGIVLTDDPRYIPAFYGATIIPFIPAIRAGINNMRVKKDLREKVLHKQEIIYPGERCEKIVFVKSSDYRSMFALSLHEKYSIDRSVVFYVDLDGNQQ